MNMGVELSNRIEETIKSKSAGSVKSAEILVGQEEAQKLSQAIEVKGSEEEISEIQEVATSARIPRVIGLAKLTQDIREGFEQEAKTTTDPELVYALIGEKSKTLERFSEILSRIQVFKQIISGNEEVISQINAWEQTINEIVNQILSTEDKDKFHASVLEKVSKLSTEPSEEGKDSYQDRFKKLVQNPRALKHLNRYLKPEKGEKFSSDLIKEYFETANFINVLNLMKKLEAPIDQMSQRNERIVEPEINFLEAKRTIQAAIAEVEKIKASSLDPETKKAKLAEQDQKVKDILTVCGNKIAALFPHVDIGRDASNSTLRSVLQNEIAICAGKVEVMAALIDFFGLEHNKIAVPGHTYLDITLPSGDLLIQDGNLEADTKEEKNRFYMLEAEKLDPQILEEGLDKLSPEMKIRIIRRKEANGKMLYFLSKKKPAYKSHLAGSRTSNETAISTIFLTNTTEEFKSSELENFKQNFYLEYYFDSFKVSDENLPLILEFLQSGKLSTENLLSKDTRVLSRILIFIKNSDLKLFEKISKESQSYLEKIGRTDKDYYLSTDLQINDILVSSMVNEEYCSELVDKLSKQENIDLKKLNELIKVLSLSKIDINIFYKLLEIVKTKDENFWNSNGASKTYLEKNKYFQYSPTTEESIQDYSKLAEFRKFDEINFDKIDEIQKDNIKGILINILRNGTIDQLINSEAITEISKQNLMKLLLNVVRELSIDITDRDEVKKKKLLVSVYEALKSKIKDITEIEENKINRELLVLYEDENSKFPPLIQEIKEKDPKEFYSRFFTIEFNWNKYPEKRQEFLEEILQNKNLLFSWYIDFSDEETRESNERTYHELFSKLITLIETGLGSDAKERFIKETGYQPKSTS